MAGNAIAFLLTALTAVPLANDLFPQSRGSSTVVRVAAGLSLPRDGDYARTGGNTPSIALFDESGERIGFKSGARHGKIGDGKFKDIVVEPINKDNSRAPAYLSVPSSGNDALCIADIYITPPSKEFWAFFGDVPKECGVAWYRSNLPVQRQNGDPFKPRCFWIDSPDTGKTTSSFPQGAGIHLTDFTANQGRVQQYQISRDTMCASAPRFSFFAALKTPGQVMCRPGPNEKPTAKQILQLQKWTGGRVSTPTYGVKTRSVKARQNDRVCFADHQVVVVSEHREHTASELCKSTSAAGPDFVSTKEGLFCDMCTGELWPLCSKNVPTGCFDVDLKVMRASDGAVTRTGLHARDVITGRDIPEKEYKKVAHWK
ncbi:hypothetical protein KXX14_004168 [Aspergillus fumigatus]|uniref:Uncharacterized protein n=1 Tax=Aspergillus fumigatus TaxID=746128 RepID=A0A9P8NAJ5_ASPFM|nr:hypothetical protein KXX14_004168 [Aspergillus fumigatus]KAH1896225.1 hypothetical protein KXV57_001454 [Aspergillus fumigatus]